MKKFQFKLETVLKMKVRLEEERQLELYLAEQARLEAERQYARRGDEIRETATSYLKLLKEDFNLRTAGDYNRFLDRLYNLLEQEFRHLCNCRLLAAEARERLLIAAKEKKSLEKLKEKAYQEYQTVELHQDIKFLDEVGTDRFSRREARD